tara:strand:+ start:311 stop:715 length:405 start_codon:yes stop_codon:yes gene_type:complete
MKKLNLNNKVSDDDEKLICILKTSIGREPSEQFVENTLKKFLVLNAKSRKVHKPLISPLYLMLVIGLILLAAVPFSLDPQIYLSIPELKLENLIEDISFQLDSWYTLSLMIMGLILMTVAWIELGVVKYRNPFV